jgi:hypothetical protein
LEPTGSNCEVETTNPPVQEINVTKRFLFVFAILALAVASAKTYSVRLFQDSVLAGTELKAGDYRIDLTDSKIVLKSGKQVVESAVKVEQSDTKYSATTVRFANADGKYRIQEIRLGGTNLKLVVD